MPKTTAQKKSNGNDSGLNFEAQLWAAAEQAVPAPTCETLEYNGGRPQALGRVYEYFLGKFASAEGTLQSATAICSALGISLSASNGERVGVRCRNPRMNRRRIHSVRGKKWPCAGTTTWKLARMNLAIRGQRWPCASTLGTRNADSFRTDLNPDVKADFLN